MGSNNFKPASKESLGQLITTLTLTVYNLGNIAKNTKLELQKLNSAEDSVKKQSLQDYYKFIILYCQSASDIFIALRKAYQTTQKETIRQYITFLCEGYIKLLNSSSYLPDKSEYSWLNNISAIAISLFPDFKFEYEEITLMIQNNEELINTLSKVAPSDFICLDINEVTRVSMPLIDMHMRILGFMNQLSERIVKS